MTEHGFYTPVMNRHIVSRKKLFDRLDYTRDCKLTLVTAPAGYGKTTAVLDWANKCGLPVLWLPISEYNNTPKAFWKDVCAVLSGIAPDLSKESEYILSSAELLGAHMHINIILDKLSKASADFVLILDDLHLITDASILSALSYLVNYLPEKMHLIIISRTAPELELSRFSVKWQMQKIGVKDLQFQREDIFRFYKARNILLQNDEIARLETYTEGWAASLVTIALSLEREEIGSIASASLSELGRDIGRYLKDEVIIGWSEEKKRFALKTSVLDVLSEDLCGAVTDSGGAGKMLTELYEDNGFLFALDREKKRYRYHLLFRDFLMNLLSETNPGDVSALQKKAGDWYLEHGDTIKAVEFFLKSGAYTEVMSILEHNAVVYVYDINTLFNWLEQIPLPLKENSFKAAYIYATYYADTDRLDTARVWGGRMKEIAALPFYNTRPELIIFCRIACIIQETTLLIREGNADFLSYFVCAIEPHKAKHFEFPAYFNFNTGDIFFYRCPVGLLTRVFGEDRERYEALFENYWKIVPFIQKPGYKVLLAGEYYYETDSLDEALPCLLEAMEAASQTGCPGVLVPAMVDIARVKRAKGDFDGAFSALDECEKKLKSIGEPHWNYLIAAFRCRLSIDKGDAKAVENWFSSCKLDAFSDLSNVREYELLVYGRTLLFLNRLQDAETLLNRLLIFCEKVNRYHSKVETLNLLAVLEYKRHHLQKALRYLDRSLFVGEDRKYFRSYSDESEPMDKLLSLYIKHHTALAKKKNADFAALLLERMKSSGNTHVIKLTEALTVREREVLSLLTEAYTNQEISDRLGITLQTVKNHIGNIYGKLGVKNRVQCQRVAGEISL